MIRGTSGTGGFGASPPRHLLAYISALDIDAERRGGADLRTDDGSSGRDSVDFATPWRRRPVPSPKLSTSTPTRCCATTAEEEEET